MTQIIFNDLVAGLSHACPQGIYKTHKGYTVTLTHEPENEYDARAIRVDYNGQKLGYIPAEQTAQIHSAWDNGLIVTTIIRHVKLPEGKTTYTKIWLRATIELDSE